MTSFLQVKQVKSSPGLLSQVPLLCKCAQRAVRYICSLAAWQEPREDVLHSGLTVPCVASVCVCGQGANVWLRTQDSRSQLKLSHFLPFCLCSSTSIFSVAIPCRHFMCFALYCALLFLHSFFLERALKFVRTNGSCLLSAACPVFWSLSLFGKVDMNVGVW